MQKNLEYIVLQAGGKGSRLGGMTKNKPKALVPYENLPIIFHLFQRFSGANFIIVKNVGTLTAEFEGMLLTVVEGV